MSIKARNNLMRQDLGIYANVVHAKSNNGLTNTRFNDIDIYIVRENSEGEYSGKEHESVPGVVESLKIMTRPKCEKIARFAFEWAVSHNRKKVTCVHKANIMKQGDGLFLKVATEVAKDYPEIAFEGMIVDNTCMQLVSNPWQFDVMLLPNLYGNIVANVCCGLTGGAGLTAGSNYSGSINTAHGQVGLFEMALRNTGAGMAGKNLANPTSFLMAGVKLLEYNKMYAHANLIRPALYKTLNEDKVHTADLGGAASTTEFMMSFSDNLRSSVEEYELKA
jgi:isocitrate dehydrogenase (NAD+)